MCIFHKNIKLSCIDCIKTMEVHKLDVAHWLIENVLVNHKLSPPNAYRLCCYFLTGPKFTKNIFNMT